VSFLKKLSTVLRVKMNKLPLIGTVNYRMSGNTGIDGSWVMTNAVIIWLSAKKATAKNSSVQTKTFICYMVILIIARGRTAIATRGVH
jgi:hypothetical protein